METMIIIMIVIVMTILILSILIPMLKERATRRFNRIKQIPIIQAIAIMWTDGMGRTGYCNK